MPMMAFIGVRNFVAHAGQKVALGAIGDISGIFRALELFHRYLQFFGGAVERAFGAPASGLPRVGVRSMDGKRAQGRFDAVPVVGLVRAMRFAIVVRSPQSTMTVLRRGSGNEAAMATATRNQSLWV